MLGNAAPVGGEQVPPTDPDDREREELFRDRSDMDWITRAMRRIPPLRPLARWLDADEVDINALPPDDVDDESDQGGFFEDLGVTGASPFAACGAACTGRRGKPDAGVARPTPAPEVAVGAPSGAAAATAAAAAPGS